MTTQRRVYMIPESMIERVTAFQAKSLCNSEAEAIRKLLTYGLNYTETDHELKARLQGLSYDEALFEAFDHVSVKSVNFNKVSATIETADGTLIEVFREGRSDG